MNRIPKEVLDAALPETVTPAATYPLEVTHDEIHLVFWALNVAEALAARDVAGSLETIATYRALREAVVSDDAMEAFAHKFDATHALAKTADGE